MAVYTSAIQDLLGSSDATVQVATQQGGSRTVATNSELTKRVQLLEGLLCVPATLEYAAPETLASFFEDLFRGLAGKHSEHALAKAAMGCLVNFFMYIGPDAFSQMPKVRCIFHTEQRFVPNGTAPCVQERLAPPHVRNPAIATLVCLEWPHPNTSWDSARCTAASAQLTQQCRQCRCTRRRRRSCG